MCQKKLTPDRRRDLAAHLLGRGGRGRELQHFYHVSNKTKAMGTSTIFCIIRGEKVISKHFITHESKTIRDVRVRVS